MSAEKYSNSFESETKPTGAEEHSKGFSELVDIANKIEGKADDLPNESESKAVETTENLGSDQASERLREHELVEIEKDRIRFLKATSAYLGALQYYELTPYSGLLGRIKLPPSQIGYPPSKRSADGPPPEHRWALLYGFARSLTANFPFQTPGKFFEAAHRVRSDLLEEARREQSMSFVDYRKQPTGKKLESEDVARATFIADQYGTGFSYHDGSKWVTANKEYYEKQDELFRDMIAGFCQAALQLGDVETALQGYREIGMAFSESVLSRVRERVLDLQRSDKEEDKRLLRLAAKAILQLAPETEAT